MFLKNQKSVLLIFWMLGCLCCVSVYFSGCTRTLLNKNSGIASKEALNPQSMLAYIEYVQENQKNINQIYSRFYRNYEYFVDSNSGSIRIQNLINPELAHLVTGKILTKNQAKTEKVIECFNYIIRHFKYFPMPEVWPTISQTLKIRKGDCKGLSLLLLSVLLFLDIECYAAIGNGHMWVVARLDGQQKIFETDSDPNRKLIYQLPGFYEKPLYKIYYNRSEKRIRMKGGNATS